MNWNKWIRQSHRWLSVAFTVVVIAIFAIQGFGREPAEWVYLLPLLPLFFLFLTGLYMFVLPYAAKGSRARSTSS
ncbi:MAG: hypothetical protein ACPW61_07250 [Methyloligella sp. ZOD6]